MSLIDNKNSIKNIRERNYLARDFDGFRTVILEYAKRYYPDRIQDFSEASMGGLFLDMAAYVGDNLSFYLDHLYGELNSSTAVEVSSIENAIRNAGISITGASPAVVDIDFYIEIPVLKDGTLLPDPKLLPTIIAGTTVKADNGVIFTLVEDINFSTVDIETGIVSVDKGVIITNGSRSNITNTVITKILKKSGIFSSGTQTSQAFPIGGFTQFRTLTLSRPDVTQIISVTDGYGNVYYEVDNLTNDVVYRNVLNTAGQDNSLVKDSLKVIAAPYRFVKTVSLSDRLTTLMFGGGTAENFENDIIPDPSEFAIALPYSQTFSTRSINPQKLLQTSTLGITSSNTTLNVLYRSGGGASHNVPARTIRNISNINIMFPENPSPALQLQIKNGIEASNPLPAKGGDNAPSSDMLVSLIPTVKNSQNRIVTKEDMLSRIYTMPSNFGRVFRAAVAKNPNNPLAAQLFVISKDENDELIVSPDMLKINLKRYLNSYRMISDSIDLLDASIINMELFFQVVVDPSYNKTSLLQNIIIDIKKQFKIQNFHINQPIVMSDIMSTIFTNNGVISVDIIKFNNLSGTVKNKFYSPITFDVNVNTKNKIIYPPAGGIFEIKYPDINIIGKAITNA